MQAYLKNGIYNLGNWSLMFVSIITPYSGHTYSLFNEQAIALI